MKDEIKPSRLASILPRATLQQLVPSHPPEREFQDWYREMSDTHDLAPNPDSPDQFYDYRSAFAAGASPDDTGHWPSTFKREGHPNMVVGGFHVKTGQRVSGAKLAGSLEELIDMGWDVATARRLWKSVQR